MKISIRTKILVTIVSGLLLLSSFSLYYIRSDYFRQLDKLSSQSLKTNRATFANILEYDKVKLLVALEIIFADNKTKDFFINEDVESLYNYTSILFQQLKQKFNITHWYFIKQDKSCFLRVHRKNKRNDIIQRKTLDNCAKTNKYSMGLELGSRAFAYRVVCPYYDDGQLIGYMEMSEEIDHFSQLMKKQTGDDFVLLINKQYLNKDKWNKARKEYPEMAVWDEFKDIIVINRTTKLIKVNGLEGRLENIPDKGIVLEKKYKIGDDLFFLGAFPVYDASKQNVGTLIYIHKVTDIYKKMISSSVVTSVSFILLAIILIIIIVLIINRSIINPLGYARRYISELSRGNLVAELTVHSDDEIGSMLEDLKRMTINLTSTLLTIKNSVDNINATTGKLYTSSNELSQSNIMQKNSVEEISEEITEISQKIKQSDDNAKETLNNTNIAAEKLEQGKSAFNETEKAMHDIVSKVSIISDIAFQTNIIAINAAIEAAAAGELGKGFSVVAKEVKKMAEISTNSAGNINQLSVSSIELAENSKNILNEIIEQMQKVAEMINEVSLASVEQNNSINHVNEAINSLHSLSQQIVSFSSVSAEMVKELNEQTKEMFNVVSFFKFEKND